jgi:hypothetical protein
VRFGSTIGVRRATTLVANPRSSSGDGKWVVYFFNSYFSYSCRRCSESERDSLLWSSQSWKEALSEMAVHLIQFLCLISALFPSLFFALSETTCSAPLHNDRLICELYPLKHKISQLGTISISRLIFIDRFVHSIELPLTEVFAFNVIWTFSFFLLPFFFFFNKKNWDLNWIMLQNQFLKKAQKT